MPPKKEKLKGPKKSKAPTATPAKPAEPKAAKPEDGKPEDAKPPDANPTKSKVKPEVVSTAADPSNPDPPSHAVAVAVPAAAAQTATAAPKPEGVEPPAEGVSDAMSETRLIQTLETDFQSLMIASNMRNVPMTQIQIGTAQSTEAALLKSKLNENIFTMISTRKKKADAAWNRTEERPFINPGLTGDEVVDVFVAQRLASLLTEEDANVKNVGDYDDEEDEEAKEGQWKESSAWRRALMIVLMAIGLALLCHMGAAAYLFYSKEIVEHPYLCKSEQCRRISDWIQEGVQPSAEPCDDFYEFACGKWVSNNPPPDTRIYRANSEGIPFNYLTNEGLGRVLRRIKTYPLNQILPFYQACIAQNERDKVGFQPFVHLLLQLKLLAPVKSSTVDISRTIVRIYKRTNKLLLIDIYSTIQNFIVLGLRDVEREYLLTTDPVDYEQAMRKAFTLLSKELLIDDLTEIDTIVYLVMRFEAELIMLQSQEKLIIFGFPEMSKYVKAPAKLHSSYSPVLATFSFDALMTELFEHQRSYANVSIFFNYIHSISQKESRLYMVYLTEFLNRTPYYVIIRYFQWALIKHFALDLTWELQEIMVYIFRWVGQDPAERCFRNMFSKLHVLAAIRYSKELGNPEALDKKMSGMVTKIATTLQNLTQNLPKDALDSFKDTFATFSIVETSISTFEKNLGLFYEGLDMRMDKHFENVLQTSALKANNDFKKIQNIPPYHTWPAGDYSVDQVTLALIQQVGTVKVHRFLHIPFGALQEPFMGNDLPILNYAGFGFWIGAYYLMHYTIYDLLEVIEKYRYDDSPETYVLPEKQMEKEILPSMECILGEYHKVMEKQSADLKVDPTHQTSRVKNLAFFLAAGLITDTLDKYKNNNDSKADFPKWQVLPGLEKYTAEQLLFISIARHTCKSISPHTRKIMKLTGVTDAAFQINAAYRNSKAFSKAFKCSSKRFMNPKKKCEFFRKVNRPVVGNETVVKT